MMNLGLGIQCSLNISLSAIDWLRSTCMDTSSALVLYMFTPLSALNLHPHTPSYHK